MSSAVRTATSAQTLNERPERMYKAVVVPAALAAGIGLAPLLAPGVAHADPVPCAPTDIACGMQYDEYFNANCRSLMNAIPPGQPATPEYLKCIDAFPGNPGWCDYCKRAKTSSSAPPPMTTPAQAPVTTAGQSPPAPKAAVVRPPKGLSARPEDIDAAKSNRSGPFDPASPPKSPDQKDFSQRVQNMVDSHSRNVDVVNGQVHPRHWDYVDQDQGHPVIYNPMGTGMTFRYYYEGDYREAYVEAGSSLSFSISEGGVFPFTAVGGDYLTTGSFYAGTPPTIYQNVNVYLPAYGQTVQVDKVVPLGHDDSKPAGSQDTFMLDDSTLATGQATNPVDGGQISVAKTQTLPNVGPTDDGKSLIDLAVASHPQSNKTPWLIGALGGAALVTAAGLVAWLVIRRKRSADLDISV
jgi:hypothetical protein